MAVLKLSRLPLFPLIVAREKLARGLRARQVGGEPAVMDEPQGVREYDQLGAGGQVGIHQFNALAISRLLAEDGTLLDLGCGSRRLLARLAHGRPDARIVGVDLSAPQLDARAEPRALEQLPARFEHRLGSGTSNPRSDSYGGTAFGSCPSASSSAGSRRTRHTPWTIGDADLRDLRRVARRPTATCDLLLRRLSVDGPRSPARRPEV